MTQYLRNVLRIGVLAKLAVGVTACGNPGAFEGTYSGTMTSDVEPQLQASTTVIIGPSSGTPDLSVHIVQAGVIDCTFDANRSGSGASAAMIPRGGCQMTTPRGALVWDWEAGMVTLSGTQLGLNLTGSLTAAYAPTSRASGETFLISYNGNR